MCDNLDHRCDQCSEELKALRLGDRPQGRYESEMWKRRPLGLNHQAIRFGDRGLYHTHDLYLDGEIVNDGAFEWRLGPEGWMAFYIRHPESGGREAHIVHDDPGACIEILHGHVELKVRPNAGRLIAVMARQIEDIRQYDRATREDGDDDALTLTTTGNY